MKKVGIILIALGFIFVGIGFLYFYFGDFSSHKKTSSFKRVSTKEYSEYVSDIQKTTIYFDTYMSNIYSLDNVDAISVEEKTLFILRKICNYQTKTVSVSQVEEEAKFYFIDFDAFLQDVKNNKGQVLYSYQNNQYTYVASEDKLCTFATLDVSSDGYDDLWVVKKKYYYIKSSLGNNDYLNTVYLTLNDCINEKNKIHSFGGTTTFLLKEDINTIQSKLKTITYQFIRRGKNYYMNSIQMEK